jgi:hypothetical protein
MSTNLFSNTLRRNFIAPCLLNLRSIPLLFFNFFFTFSPNQVTFIKNPASNNQMKKSLRQSVKYGCISVSGLIYAISLMFLFIQTAFTGGGLPTQLGENGSLMDAMRLNRSSLFAPFVEKTRLLAQDAEIGNNYGNSVAISGDTAIVGAYLDDTGGFNGRGSAYIYVRNGSTWTQQQEITPGDTGTSKWFGYSVAIDGDTVVVGAILDANSRGSAYVFVRNGSTWTQQQKLAPTTSNVIHQFGISVDISGNTAVIGAPGETINGTNQQGSAYVFFRNGTTWTQQDKLTANDGGPGHLLGSSVAIDGNTVVCGAPQTDFNRGSAYIFTRNITWQQEQKLVPSDGETEDHFGTSVAIAGNTAIVGAYKVNVGATGGRGAAYVYVRNGENWLDQQKLYPDDGQSEDFFGYSVAIENDLCLVNATGVHTAEDSWGAVYAFTRNGTVWNQRQKFFNETDPLRDSFGLSVGLSGNTAILGAPGGQATGDNERGSAYIYASPNVAGSAPFDFDGDSKTDISIFRPSNGEWWYLKSSNGGNAAFQFGNSSDKLAPADFTGDGKTDIAVWRPSTGEWFVLRSEDYSYYSFPFGTNGDVPAPADFDGDAKADVAVFRPSNSFWYINRSTGGTTIQQFGQSGDVPVAADYDGDAKADIAIFRPSVREWWIQRSAAGLLALQFGAPGDKPVQGDFTGDGKADVAIWHPTGDWFVLRSEDHSYYSFPFGTSGDVPAPGDYDGDGKFDAGIFRPSSSTWYVQRSTAGTLIQTFGTTGDRPVPNAFVP